MNKQQTISKNKNILINKYLKIVIVSIVVFLIPVVFIYLKENFYIDEIFTYGLANSQFQLLIEDYKEYSGEELLIKYASATNHLFDVKNVFFNQQMDTHPPLYYLLVNFVCSLFPNSFSKYYGLIINCFGMVFVFWLIRSLLILTIENKKYANIMSFCFMFFYGFINCYVFTRMYVVLIVFALSLLNLIFYKIKEIYENNNLDNSINKSDLVFLLKFIVINFLGVMTQYQYIFFACAICIVFAICLIISKKIKFLLTVIISGIVSIALAIWTFPAIISHIFTQDSIHSLSNKVEINYIRNFMALTEKIVQAFFANVTFLILFFAVVFCLIIIKLIKNKKDKRDSEKLALAKKIHTNMKYFICFSLLFISVFYFICIIFMAKINGERYIYIIYPLIAVFLYSILFYLTEKKFISIIVLVAYVILSLTKTPSYLYLEAKQLKDYLHENKSVKTLILYSDSKKVTDQVWKLPYNLYINRELENIRYVNIENINYDKYLKVEDEDKLLVYFISGTDPYIQQKNQYEVMHLVNTFDFAAKKVFSTTYVDLYEFHR